MSEDQHEWTEEEHEAVRQLCTLMKRGEIIVVPKGDREILEFVVSSYKGFVAMGRIGRFLGVVMVYLGAIAGAYYAVQKWIIDTASGGGGG